MITKKIMKKVYYNREKNFTLTDKEFKKAMQCWNEQKNYWCPRQKLLLTPRFLFVEPSLNFFIKIDEIEGRKYVSRFFKANNGKIYLEGSNTPVSFQNKKEEKKFKKQLISEDDYYDNKKYLNKSNK